MTFVPDLTVTVPGLKAKLFIVTALVPGGSSDEEGVAEGLGFEAGEE